ncbi:MAG: hypothetical protein KGJ89_01320 [Patescibacteria group bacterium]|nr:hypothetical protein [Patescibacteria group bacterium]MDE2015152.1 hypothetical protein [Patescibacteria group bacterium]MDE2226580.1 hypothetical protein [Patescibacteria group bacterium]
MKRSIYWLTMALLFSCAANSALAATVSINTSLPFSTGPDIPSTVNAFYKYALYLGGILAFGAVVFGGVKYIFAAGNPSGQSEGKDWIKSALLGLVLLGGAYLILNVINPNLVNLNLPTLSPANVSSIGVSLSSGQTMYGCAAPNGILACAPSCSTIQGCGGNPCFLLDTNSSKGCGNTASLTTCTITGATLVWKDANNQNTISTQSYTAYTGDTVYMDGTINGDCSGVPTIDVVLYSGLTSDYLIPTPGYKLKLTPDPNGAHFATFSQSLFLDPQLHDLLLGTTISFKAGSPLMGGTWAVSPLLRWLSTR